VSRQARQEALRLHDAGLCVLPVIDQHPTLRRWEQFKRERPARFAVADWFGRGDRGIGVVGGQVAGGAEFLDFDNHQGGGCVFLGWAEKAWPVVRRLCLYRTPRDGWRAAWRCPEYLAEAKMVLARRSKEDVLVELLAAQTVVVPGGDLVGHVTRRPYRAVQGDLADLPVISPEERARLIELARGFNEYVEEPRPEPAPRAPGMVGGEGDSHGPRGDWWASDDFNLRGDWEAILAPKDWVPLHGSGDVTYWRRPDKAGGASATTNYAGRDLLHVFTSSTAFEADRSYSKYAAYAILYHGGDYSAASKELARLGYGRANDDLNVYEAQIKQLFGARGEPAAGPVSTPKEKSDRHLSDP
jgi:hypothetical protein